MNAYKSQKYKKAVFKQYNLLLERLMVPYEELTIKTRTGDTFILAAGDIQNPSIFLLHGSGMNSSMWINDINTISQGYRVYAPDLPGEPGKSDEEQLPFDTTDYTDWLSDVFNSLSLQRAIIVGASLGAWIATKFAIANPQKVDKLVLLCPVGIGSQNHDFEDIALSLLAKGEKGVNELFTLINGGNPVSEEIMNYLKLIAVSFNSRQEPIPTISDDELSRLTMPCALFVGSKDIMLRSDETVERISKLVPHAEVTMLEDKGHSLTGFADKIVEFIGL